MDGCGPSVVGFLALSASSFFTTIVFVLFFDPPSYTVFIDTPSNFCFLECNT